MNGMRILMKKEDKDKLYDFVKDDDIARTIADKIMISEDTTLFKRIKNFRKGIDNDISEYEKCYLNDILGETKFSEEYPVVKRINSNIYFLKDNQLKAIDEYEPIDSEPSKVVGYFNDEIRQSSFPGMVRGGSVYYIYLLADNLYKMEIL